MVILFVIFPLLLTVVGLNSTYGFDSTNMVMVIRSQPEPYHARVAKSLKNDIEGQILDLEKRLPTVLLTHKEFPKPGTWTLVPLFQELSELYKGSDVRWILFFEAHTHVDCARLIETMKVADSNNATVWTGYPLTDEEPTIIHHFKFYEELNEDHGGFLYPYFASGFAMRLSMIDFISTSIRTGKTHIEADFSIDPAFELAQLIYEVTGHLLTPNLSFCVVPADHCATYPKKFDVCGTAVSEESIYFAVKTFSGFHQTRARVVKKTWGKHLTHIRFFSDIADPSIPTIDIGVPNTKRGHCAKTIAILKHVSKEVKTMPSVKWVFLADDDTILGVQRLCEVLSCYRGGKDVTILGEVYGFGFMNKKYVNKGYDYITGGGGTVLSVAGVNALSKCTCVGPDSPDDMTLGLCAKRFNITLTHSHLFHQAKPQDYSREVLSWDRPISFHGHSNPEPNKVYAVWFQHEDMGIKKIIKSEL